MKKLLTVCLLLIFAARAYSQIISTFAGNGYNGWGNNGIPTYSGDGGLAIDAQLNPYNIATDSKGNVYISQASAFYTVRKIDIKTNIITTVAGNGTKGFSGDGGPAIAAQLNEPRGIAFDSKDNLYIADYWNNCIRRVDAITGIITTIAGNGAVTNGYTGNGGPAKDALLFEPQDIAIDASDNIYIADFNNNCIRKIAASSGIITKIAGSDPPGYAGFSGDGGPATSALLFAPISLVLNKAGDVIFCDFVNNRVRKIDAKTGIITTIAGNGEQGFNGDGGLAVNAQIYGPYASGIDASGNLYLCMGVNNVQSYKIRKIDAITGVITTVAGTGANGYNGDGGSPLNAQLGPSDLTFDKTGNMFIGDEYSNYRIREITYTELTMPSISFKNNCDQSPVLFNLQSTNGYDSIIWNFGDTTSALNNTSNSFTTQHTFAIAGTYTVSATVLGATSSKTATQTIQITDCTVPIGPGDPGNTGNTSGGFTLPNTFTPNHDGINDVFTIASNNAPTSFTINIYNRWGQLLFTSKNINKSWDGKFQGADCAVGVYYYVINYQFATQPPQIKSGNVTVLR